MLAPFCCFCWQTRSRDMRVEKQCVCIFDPCIKSMALIFALNGSTGSLLLIASLTLLMILVAFNFCINFLSV